MERNRDPVAGFVLVTLAGTIQPASGRLEAAALREAIAEASAHGHPHVALDMSPVRIIDAETLGELLAAFTRQRRAGGDLVLLDPQERVRRLLAVTRLDTVLPLWSREVEADVVADRAEERPSAPGWFLARVRQGRDLRIAESVTDVLSAAAGGFRFGGRVAPVVR